MMKLHVREDEVNEVHVRVSIFIDGASVGQLCMTTEAYNEFRLCLEAGWTVRHGYQYTQANNAGG